MTATSTDQKPYDLFVSYADDDRDWVEGYLLDALDQAKVVSHHESAFALGSPRLVEFQEAVEKSKRTLLVLSPAYFASNVSTFVDLLAQTYGQEQGLWPVIPMILAPVELPPRLKMVQGLDASDPKTWDRAVERLCRELQRPPPEAASPPPCPYPGMTPFSEDRSDYFFGREEEVEELVQRLRLHNFLAVIGPSGSGKSSLVAAGLLPALRRTGFFGPGSWEVRRMRPGAHPLAALAAALDGDPDHAEAAVTGVLSGPDGRLLLFVDQLEELFTVAQDDVDAFQAALARLVEVPRCYVVVTLRADFYPELMTCPLWPLAAAHRFEVLPLDEDHLRDAIVRPAEHSGVFVEAALVERLLADAAGEPGLLPLVQETMVCLWERLERRLLPLRAYEALVLPHRAYGDDERSGLQVALARQADATMGQLPPSGQAVARRIFVRLVQFGEGRSDVRRQQPESALRTTGEDSEEFDAVLEHLASRRLITLGGEGKRGDTARHVDLAHEALISGWPMLRTWLDERRDAEQTRRRLAAKAAEWARLGQERGGLLDQVELLEAQRWLESPDNAELGIDGQIVDLVASSGRALEEAEQEREAARRRELDQANALAAEQQRRADVEKKRADEQLRARRSLGRRARALTVLTCVMLVVAVFATTQQRRADREALVARSRALAAQARLLADERLDLALLLSREAYRVSPTVEARGSLFAALERHPRLTTFLQGPTDRAGPAVFSPDGSLVASGGDDDRVFIWKTSTGAPVGQPLVGHTDDVRAVAFTPDGRLLLTAGHDSSVLVWDVASGARVGAPVLAHTDRVRTLALSPDGATVASGGEDHTILLWDLASRRIVATLAQGSEVNSVAFAPDGASLVAADDDGRVLIWDVATRQVSAVLSGHDDLARTASFSPDGRTIASAGNDRRILLWDVASRAVVGELTGHAERVFSLAFSADGQVLASGGRDSTVILWDVASRQPLGPPLTGHSDSVRSVAFARDGTLVTASDDHTIALWRLEEQHRLGRPLPAAAAAVAGMSVAGDGTVLAVASADGTLSVWDLNTRRPLADDLIAGRPLTSVSLSGDGSRLAAGTSDGGVTVWDLPSRRPLLEEAGDGVHATITVALDARGETLVTGGQDRVVRRWDVGGGRLRGEPIPGPAEWLSLSLSPDGRRLAAGALDGRLWFWDDATADRPRGRVLNCQAGADELLCGRPLQTVAFAPDGVLLAAGSADNTVSLWDPTKGGAGGPVRRLSGHRQPVRSVVFSHDGRTLASAGQNGSVVLWDTATGHRLGDALAGHEGAVTGVAFGPGDRSLVSGGDDQGVLVWDVDVSSWASLACRVANRNLTPEEWSVYVGVGTRRTTCPDLP